MSMKVTMAEFVGLEPCPFCGGEAEIIDEHDEYIAKWGEPFDEWEFGTASYWYKAVVCCVDKGGCGAIGGWRKTEAEAIKAWNTRAERTCEPKWVLQGKTQTQEFWRCECGNCGECFGIEERSSFPFKMTIDEVEIPNYCQNCGVKVVNNDNQ